MQFRSLLGMLLKCCNPFDYMDIQDEINDF